MSLSLFEERVTSLLTERSLELKENFPETAAAILKECIPQEGFTPADLVRELIVRPTFVRQRDREAKFGDPPVTLLEVDDAFCDIYFWHKDPTSIHSHTFEGAFALGHGLSVHSTYSFQREQTFERAHLGRMVHEKTELLKVGDVRLILPGERLNHRVSHLGCPSVSFVIRRGNFGPASHFVSPRLELPYLRNLPPHVKRKFLVIEMARRTKVCSLGECLKLVNESWPAQDMIHFLQYQLPTWNPAEFKTILDESGLSNEPWSDPLIEAHRWQNACGGYQCESQDPEDRLVWSLGSSFGNRESSRRALQQYFESESVGVRTVDVLLRLIEAKLLPLELNESAQVLLEVLIDEGKEQVLIEELVEVHGEEKRTEIAADLTTAAQTMRAHPFLSAFTS